MQARAHDGLNRDNIINIEPRTITLQHDDRLLISTGSSRFEKSWKNKQMKWSALLSKLSISQGTGETHAEYMKMTKDQQDRIKDIGGFVGGHLKDGSRKTGNVVARQLITLDMDNPPRDWRELLSGLPGKVGCSCAMGIYSTHKHTEKTPRLRLLMPLDREVSPEEYEAISRKLAEKIGIDFFDDSTYQPTRLMYWPSHSCDVEPVFQYVDAEFLSADRILQEYPDWTDVSYWPESGRATKHWKAQADKQGDPTQKKGIVGAFCRTYTIPEAISKFLPEIYTPTAKEDRYTFAAGSTAAGLVLYDGDHFAYSNHSTDPAGGQLCNAFDLVRLHRFGELDEGSEDKTGKDRPSYKAMAEFASEDQETRITLSREQKEAAVLDFEDDEDGSSWEAKLSRTRDGSVKPDTTNAILILQNDPELQGIRFNELSGAVEVNRPLPWSRPNQYWRDADDAQLYCWVADRYGVQFPQTKFIKAFTVVADQRRFNPLRDYVDGLPAWDGKERVEELLIDYLGAADTPYTRAVTRKTLIGAIQRVLHPGCKFDTVLVLDGKPGIGKSTLLRKLGREWFSDSLSLTDTRDKSAAEKLQGVWIMEIGEMQGTRKADIDVLKSFISRQVDEYRAAYGRVVERHPRTGIICGTTNSTTGFLRDTTGNRKWWPVNVEGDGLLSVWDMTDEEVSQIWAEAKTYTLRGEASYLDPEMEKEAVKAQQAALIYDEREDQVIEYLETLIPESWYEWDLHERFSFFQNPELRDQKVMAGKLIRRMKVSTTEIYCECFGRPKTSWTRRDGDDIVMIMARIPGWSRPAGATTRDPAYGRQRVFVRTDQSS
jgi:predicted P-loop ATPase